MKMFFHPVEEEGEDQNQRQVVESVDRIGEKGLVIGGGLGQCHSEQLIHTDISHQGGVFQADDELVSQRGQRPSESLGHDDSAHGLGIGHAQGTGCLHLAPVNGLDCSPEYLRNIGRGMNSQSQNPGGKFVDVPSQTLGQTKIKKHDLHNQRGAPDQSDIQIGDPLQHPDGGDFEKARISPSTLPRSRDKKVS